LPFTVSLMVDTPVSSPMLLFVSIRGTRTGLCN
jgi:hypothetical protein